MYIQSRGNCDIPRDLVKSSRTRYPRNNAVIIRNYIVQIRVCLIALHFNFFGSAWRALLLTNQSNFAKFPPPILVENGDRLRRSLRMRINLIPKSGAAFPANRYTNAALPPGCHNDGKCINPRGFSDQI